jgi:hypothetical protein
MLGRGKRGLILTTDDSELWVIETDDDADRFIGRRVIAEGVVAELNRLKVYWIGKA